MSNIVQKDDLQGSPIKATSSLLQHVDYNDDDTEIEPATSEPLMPGHQQPSHPEIVAIDPSPSSRASNHVHFDIAEGENSEDASDSSPLRYNGWIREEDDFAHSSSPSSRNAGEQRAPLLTSFEAPSVAIASTDLGSNAEFSLEGSRPKSGILSAFMNMANSIMYNFGQTFIISPGLVANVMSSGAGIIGISIQNCNDFAVSEKNK